MYNPLMPNVLAAITIRVRLENRLRFVYHVHACTHMYTYACTHMHVHMCERLRSNSDSRLMLAGAG